MLLLVVWLRYWHFLVAAGQITGTKFPRTCGSEEKLPQHCMMRQKMARLQSRGGISGDIEHQLDDIVSQFEQRGYDEDARNSEPEVRDSMKPMGGRDGRCCPLPACISLTEDDGRALYQSLVSIALVYLLAMVGYLFSR